MRLVRQGTRRRFWLALAVGALLFPVLSLADVIQEQQARLPPPAQCADPVAGVWMSHAFYPHVSEWYVFTLTIARVPNDASALAGRIHAVFWSGTTQTAALPACGPGVDRRAVLEPARGSYDPDRPPRLRGDVLVPDARRELQPGRRDRLQPRSLHRHDRSRPAGVPVGPERPGLGGRTDGVPPHPLRGRNGGAEHTGTAARTPGRHAPAPRAAADRRLRVRWSARRYLIRASQAAQSTLRRNASRYLARSVAL